MQRTRVCAQHSRSRGRTGAAVALLMLPVVGLAWVPLYAREAPRLLDVPFFYWYQLGWVGACMLCMAVAAALLPSPDTGGSP